MKPNENQLKVIKAIKKCFENLENTDDINSSKHEHDIEEIMKECDNIITGGSEDILTDFDCIVCSIQSIYLCIRDIK